MRKLAIAVFLTLLAALAASGCNGCQPNQPPMFAALDHTGSSAEGSTQLCASELVEFAERRYGRLLGSRGEVRADVFDADTVAAPTFPVRASFSVPASAQSNPEESQNELAKDGRVLKRELDRMIRRAGPPAGGTDVVTMLASLGAAARGAGKGIVWLCSDIRDRRLPRRFDAGDVRRVLHEIRADGALPDLRDIDVVVATITVRGRRDLTSRELAALKLFAYRLVRLSGGRVVAYGPTPRLEQ